jgi:tetratricopeptide (TPR) repeat protein
VDTAKTTLTRSPYEVLKISRWAKIDEIKAKYFQLVKQYSPEYFPDEFIEIRTAYDMLKEASSRATTDISIFSPPPSCRYEEYPNYPEHPLSLFKLNQEMKALCGDQDPATLEGETLAQALHILKGIFLYQVSHGNWDDAQEVGAKILSISPEDEETLRNAVCGHWQEGFEAANVDNYGKAEEFFTQLIEKKIESGAVHQNIALAQERQGKKEESLESWGKALAFYQSKLKENPDDEYLKALILAIHKYTGGKLLEDGQGGTMTGSPKELGYACVKQGNWKKAVEALEKANKDAPDDLDVLCQLGWAYLNTNQSTKAFHMWNLAYKKSKNNSQVIDHMVRGYTIFGKRLKDQRIYNQALVQFKNALKYEPGNMDIRIELAETYFQMRNFSAALREYQRVIDVEPRNKMARQGVRESKRLGGIR